jgi:hypothetical protein
LVAAVSLVAHFYTCLRAVGSSNGGDGAVIYKHACALGREGVVSKRLGSPYRAGRSPHWLKIKNPAAPAVTGPHVLRTGFSKVNSNRDVHDD